MVDLSNSELVSADPFYDTNMCSKNRMRLSVQWLNVVYDGLVDLSRIVVV